MGSIADLYTTVRADMSRFGDELGVGLKKEGTKAGKTFSESFRISFGNVVKGGFGLGAGLGAFSLLERGISGVFDTLGNASAAAAEEEAAIAQLTTSIRENDAAWDGNIDRIERVIASRQNLAFADDEQRESLRQLVSVTGDINKALELNRTAMDLARLKGMSLESASELLGKVYAGNLGILSRYGIVLEKGATATEALAEIQRRATGQAEAYANTTEGRLVVSQIKQANALENIGQILLPLTDAFTDFTGNLADLVNGSEPASERIFEMTERMRELTGATEEANEELARMPKTVEALGFKALEVSPLTRDLAAEYLELAKSMGLTEEEVNSALSAIGAGSGITTQTAENLEALIQATKEYRLETATSTKGLAANTEALWGWTKAGAAASDTSEQAEAEARATSNALQAYVATLERAEEENEDLAAALDLVAGGLGGVRKEGKETEQIWRRMAGHGDRNKKRIRELRQEIEVWDRRYRRALRDQDSEAAAFAKSQGDRLRDERSDRIRVRDAMEAERRKLLGVKDAAEEIPDKASVTVTTPGADAALARLQRIHTLADIKDQGVLPTRGTGGPVVAGVPYVVGEARRELFIPETNGRIVPTVQTQAAGGDTYNIPLTVQGLPMRASTPLEVVQQLRRASRIGFIPRRRQEAWSR